MRLLFFATLLGACVVGEPGEATECLEPLEIQYCAPAGLLVNELTGELQSEIDPPLYEEEAIGVLLRTLQDSYNTVPDCVNVRWTDEPIAYDGEVYEGIHFDCNNMWVVWEPGTRIVDTALSHELLGHCGRKEVLGNPDNNHAEKDWWTWGGPVAVGNKTLGACEL